MATNDSNLSVYLSNEKSWNDYGNFKVPLTNSVALLGNGYVTLALTEGQVNGLCLRYTAISQHTWFLLFYNEQDELIEKQSIPHSQLHLCVHPYGPISAQTTNQDKAQWRKNVEKVLKNWKNYPVDDSEWTNHSEVLQVASVDAFMASIAKKKRTTSKKSNSSSSSADKPF